MKRPLSVIHGRDKDVLDILIPMHAVDNPSILDCTYNVGRMWKGTSYSPVRMDICGDFELDVVGDFTAMPFENESFDVIVFDPPHRPVAAGNTSLYAKYNEGIPDEHRLKNNVSDLFPPFLSEAYRVLKKEGIVLAKIADLVHNHKYHWQHVDFINEVNKTGLTPCDVIIKIDPSAGHIIDRRWVRVKHVRKTHVFWFVCRKGKCEKKN